MNHVSHYLLLDGISIQQANSISSPLTFGFPAVTGFLGAIHALNRRLDRTDLEFSGVLIACHDCDVQNYRPHQYTDYTFNQSRNPIKKDGSTASIVEEGKAHLNVTLVLEVNTSTKAARELRDNPVAFIKRCRTAVTQQRMAGGSVLAIEDVRIFDQSEFPEVRRRLFPAFVLMDARNELIAITQELQKKNPDSTAFDALVETATIHHIPNNSQSGADDWSNESIKTGRGWLVPMPVGFQAISPLFPPETHQHTRNPEYPSQYVEAVYSLGKWVFPSRLPEEFSDCFWRYSYDSENLYLVTQTNENHQGEKA